MKSRATPITPPDVEIDTKEVRLIKKLVLTPPRLGVRAFLLTGLAGTGKTTVSKQTAEFLNAEFTFIQCTSGMDEGELLYKMLPSEETASGIKIIPGKLIEAIEASKSKKSVLVLDEWDKTRPSADAFLLDFLQNARVSWRVNGKSTTQGKIENLVVFLTSNGERDFSEPLLRRVLSISLPLLTPHAMCEVLNKYGVCEKHMDLLVQVYADTIGAGLDKPATVQELVQLDNALDELGEEADWDQLLFSFVIKTEEAWHALNDYLRSNNRNKLEHRVLQSTVKEYEPESVEEFQEEVVCLEEPRMPRIKTRGIVCDDGRGITIPDDEIVCAVLSDGKYEGTTKIVQSLFPDLEEDKIGKFIVVNEDEERYLVAREPLNLFEAHGCTGAGNTIFFEEPFSASRHLIEQIVKKSALISAWSKKHVAGTVQDTKTRATIEWKIQNPLTKDAVLQGKVTDDGKEFLKFLNDASRETESMLLFENAVARIKAAQAERERGNKGGIANLIIPAPGREIFTNDAPINFLLLAPERIKVNPAYRDNFRAILEQNGTISVELGYKIGKYCADHHLELRCARDLDFVVVKWSEEWKK